MKTLIILLTSAFCAVTLYADKDQEFTFAIAKVLINEGPVQAQVKKIDKLDNGISAFIDFMNKSTTVKVKTTPDIVTFKKADEIRAMLLARGIEVQDSPGGPKLRIAAGQRRED